MEHAGTCLKTNIFNRKNGFYKGFTDKVLIKEIIVSNKRSYKIV